jgi:hypothetical protein
VAAIRQIIESVYDKLFSVFGLWRERPHELSGLRARLAEIPWRCTITVRGSTSSLVAPGWPLPTSWDIDLNPHQAFKGLLLAYSGFVLIAGPRSGKVALRGLPGGSCEQAIITYGTNTTTTRYVPVVTRR